MPQGNIEPFSIIAKFRPTILRNLDVWQMYLYLLIWCTSSRHRGDTQSVFGLVSFSEYHVDGPSHTNSTSKPFTVVLLPRGTYKVVDACSYQCCIVWCECPDKHSTAPPHCSVDPIPALLSCISPVFRYLLHNTTMIKPSKPPIRHLEITATAECELSVEVTSLAAMWHPQESVFYHLLE